MTKDGNNNKELKATYSKECCWKVVSGVITIKN